MAWFACHFTVQTGKGTTLASYDQARHFTPILGANVSDSPHRNSLWSTQGSEDQRASNGNVMRLIRLALSPCSRYPVCHIYFSSCGLVFIYYRPSESHHGNSYRCVMFHMRFDQAHQPVLLGHASGGHRAPDSLLSASGIGQFPFRLPEMDCMKEDSAIFEDVFCLCDLALLCCSGSSMERIQKLVLVGSAITRKELLLARSRQHLSQYLRRCWDCSIYDDRAALGQD